MIRHLAVLLAATLVLAPAAAQTKPSEGDGAAVDFTRTPKRITGRLPLSDQKNKRGWRPRLDLSDEFGGRQLNTKKWFPNNPKWKGRPPTYFHGSNVSLERGELVFRINQHGRDKLPDGFTHSAGFIKSRERLTYGYLEAELKLMDAPWVSGFWITHVQKDWWTEIDICENCPVVRPDWNGHDQGFDLNSNLHVFRAPKHKGDVTEHFDSSKKFRVPFNLKDDYHVWGLEWDAKVVRFYLNGVMFREVENTHWHQPLEINFNNESNKYFGAVPDDRTDRDYRVKYLRVWQRPGAGDGAPF